MEIEIGKAQLREIARDLKGIQFRLRGVHASVPLSAAERDPDAEVDTSTDPVADFHASIEHVVDELAPLIEDVLEAASPSKGGGEGEM